MSTSRGLHRRIDSDLVAQIEANGKVQRRQRTKSRGSKRLRKPIEIKDHSFKGPIRKNQKRTEYFR